MLVWLVAASYVLGVIAAIDAIMNARTPQGAIAWSVSLVSMPLVALPAYLVLGRSKFEGSAVAYEQRKHEIDALVARIRENLQPWRRCQRRGIRHVSRGSEALGNGPHEGESGGSAGQRTGHVR